MGRQPRIGTGHHLLRRPEIRPRIHWRLCSVSDLAIARYRLCPQRRRSDRPRWPAARRPETWRRLGQWSHQGASSQRCSAETASFVLPLSYLLVREAKATGPGLRLSGTMRGLSPADHAYVVCTGPTATLKLSLTVIGRPRSGWLSPFTSAASAAAAASRARSKSRTATALTLGSIASIRAIAASISSREETCRSASTFISSPALR